MTPSSWSVKTKAAAAAGLCGVIGMAGVGLTALWQPRADPAASREALPTASVAVARTDLEQTSSLDGVLTFSDPTTLFSARAGILTWIAEEGARVGCGEPLYSVDDRPVLLLCGTTPEWRSMSSSSEAGTDIEQLERNLKDLGFASADMDVDGTWTALTSMAVAAWQEASGLPVDGVVDLGDVEFLPEAVRMGRTDAELGSSVIPGQPIAVSSSSDTEVTMTVPANQRSSVAEDDAVTVVLPDGTEAGGTITAISTAASAAEEEAPEIAATVSIEDAETAGSWIGSAVQVEIVSAEKKSVLAVPVSALMALADGRYAVEVVGGDGTTEVVPVRTGMFADGLVEVAAGTLEAGDRVVVPS